MVGDSAMDTRFVDGTPGVRRFLSQCHTKALRGITSLTTKCDEPSNSARQVGRTKTLRRLLEKSEKSRRAKMTSPGNSFINKPVEAQLVVNRTFLELVVPAIEAEGDVESPTRSKNKGRRSITDTAVDYGIGSENSCGEPGETEAEEQLYMDLDTLAALRPFVEALAKWRLRSSTRGPRRGTTSNSSGIQESGADEESGESEGDTDIAGYNTGDADKLFMDIGFNLADPNCGLYSSTASTTGSRRSSASSTTGESGADTDNEELNDEAEKLLADVGFNISGPTAGPYSATADGYRFEDSQSCSSTLAPSVAPFMTMPFWPQHAGNFTENVSDTVRAAEMEEEAARLKEAAMQLEYGARLLRQETGYVTTEAKASRPASTATTKFLNKISTRPSHVGSQELARSAAVPEERRTTVMLRHLPEGYTRAALLELLETQGFKGSFDFVYLPVNFVKMHEFGYAFVNLISHEEACSFWKHFDGFSDWPAHPDIKETGEAPRACEISWGDPLQGLSAHIDRYRNSPVMHKDTPDRFKPVIFSNGVRIKFPLPTKRIRPPRLKHGSPSADLSVIIAAHDAGGPPETDILVH